MWIPLQTGRSRGYAFIEFEFPEVAAIAAESMNNYLMFGKLLKCELQHLQTACRAIQSDSSPPPPQAMWLSLVACTGTCSKSVTAHHRQSRGHADWHRETTTECVQ